MRPGSAALLLALTGCGGGGDDTTAQTRTVTVTDECFVNKRLVPTRQRFTARAVTVRDVGGRRVADRLEVYVATTTNCNGAADRKIAVLRGSRVP